MTTVAEPATTSFWQRNRIWFAVGAALVLAVAITALTTTSGPEHTDPLDPENPGPDGAQAVAEVLADHGVDITIARSAAALEDQQVGRRTTVVVTGTHQLAPSTIQRLLTHTGRGHLVLVEPTHDVGARVLDSGIRTRVEPDQVAAGCPAYADLRLTTDEALAWQGDVNGCFRTGGATMLARGTGGTVLFGAGEALTNDQVLRADNAAVALRLLGGNDRLVWYLPSYDDAAPDEAASIRDLLPDWIVPGLWLGLAAAIGLVVWRSRRLGPLSTEPLPVVVRAVETARSRGRMYRRSNDRGHAAAALRTAARRRIAEQLRLGRQAGEAAVVTAVHEHLGRPLEELRQLLGTESPPPASDEALVRLADELARITREVTRQ